MNFQLKKIRKYVQLSSVNRQPDTDNLRRPTLNKLQQTQSLDNICVVEILVASFFAEYYKTNNLNSKTKLKNGSRKQSILREVNNFR